jgi:hypothetical protein
VVEHQLIDQLARLVPVLLRQRNCIADVRHNRYIGEVSFCIRESVFDVVNELLKRHEKRPVALEIKSKAAGEILH